MTEPNVAWTEYTGEELPIACNLLAIPEEERQEHTALVGRIYGELAQEGAPEGNSVTFQFDAADFPLVSRFVANERLCCSFLAFQIELAPNQGPVWLRISGGEGTREVLQEIARAFTQPQAAPR